MPKIKSKSVLEEAVMEKITSGQVKMRPKWYFAAGSLLTSTGLAGLTISAVFLVNLTIFLIRKQGPGYGRLEMMLTTFPWWVPILAILGMIFGILLLKKYDFSYKKNFFLVVVTFLTSIIIAALIINHFELNDIWARHSLMRGLYRQLENRELDFSGGQGRMRYN